MAKISSKVDQKLSKRIGVEVVFLTMKSVFPKSMPKSFTRALLSKNTIFIKILVVEGGGRSRNLFVRPSVRASVRPCGTRRNFFFSQNRPYRAYGESKKSKKNYKSGVYLSKPKSRVFKFTSVWWRYFRTLPTLSGAKIRLGFQKV